MSKSTQIAALISSFPTQNNLEPEAVMAGFKIAVSEFSDGVVSAAVVSFIRGQVGGHDGRWLPTPAQLAKQCEVFDAPRRRMEQRRQVASQSLKYLEAPAQQSLEERQAAHAKIMGRANEFFDNVANERIVDAGVRDTQEAYYAERETKAAQGLEQPRPSVGDILDNLDVRVEDDPAPQHLIGRAAQ